MRHTSRDGIELHYEIDGDGPWLVLLHGFSQDHRVWSSQVGSLSGRYRLVRVDLRGHGKSSAPAGGYGPVEYASDVLSLLDALGIRATHMLGTHTGAAVALLLALQYPERVASLVLEGVVLPGVPAPAVDRYHARARRILAEQGIEAARTDWFEHSPFFDGIRAQPERRRAAEHWAMIDDFSGAPWLATAPAQSVPEVAGMKARFGELRQPVVLLNGSADLPEFLETASELERDLRNASRFLVPGAGAFPLWEEPDAVTPLVLSFLDAW